MCLIERRSRRLDFQNLSVWRLKLQEERHREKKTPYYPHFSNALISNTWRRAPMNSQNGQEKWPELAESISESSSECSVVENDSNLENVVEEKPLEHVPKKTAESVCEFWVQGTCVYGDQCPYLHSWFSGDKFKRLAELQGHNKALNGIALLERCDKPCSSSIGSVCSEGPWLFVGMPNVVKV
ncbi:hypothetical protein CMV_023429 [Castanea mollissima]|uniref:C3H1-type domain-containing protein n=1 Tax=Castanea mollissima TaxID=60419 RepID=A0A8J4QJT2_9ROSI|nr:hypothetical protein CMV_023429 [Castanea mollissima]